jgi:hypothetical protein
MAGLFTAQIHENAKKTLLVHAPLVQKVFGIRQRAGQGRCLVTQVAYTVEAVFPRLRASRVATHIDKHITRSVNKEGHTIAEILETFNYPIKSDHSYDIKLETRVRKYGQYDELLDDLMRGQPVMLMIDSDVCAVLLNEAISYQDGEIRATVIRHGRTGQYHALLAIGIDMMGYIIVRDSRAKYAYKGYAKIATHLLQDGWRFIDALAFEVQGFEKVWK